MGGWGGVYAVVGILGFVHDLVCPEYSCTPSTLQAGRADSNIFLRASQSEYWTSQNKTIDFVRQTHWDFNTSHAEWPSAPQLRRMSIYIYIYIYIYLVFLNVSRLNISIFPIHYLSLSPRAICKIVVYGQIIKQGPMPFWVCGVGAQVRGILGNLGIC